MVEPLCSIILVYQNSFCHCAARSTYERHAYSGQILVPPSLTTNKSEYGSHPVIAFDDTHAGFRGDRALHLFEAIANCGITEKYWPVRTRLIVTEELGAKTGIMYNVHALTAQCSVCAVISHRKRRVGAPFTLIGVLEKRKPMLLLESHLFCMSSVEKHLPPGVE